MNDRERMIALIQSAVDGCARYWAALIADHLIENDVGFIKEHKLEELGLTTRAYLALKRAGINTIEELREWDEESLLKLRDIGHAIVAEVQRKLRQAGGDGDADEIPPVPT